MYIFSKIKKRIFIYSVIIFLVFFISISLNINSIKNTSTFINNSYESIKEFDFDCDGKNDELSIISVNSTYSLKIKNSIGDILLKSKKFDYSLFDVTPSCKVNIYYVDLNRDKIPEIIVSGIKNNKSAFYIFQWVDNIFEEVLFSEDNILGILDYNNSRTPKIYTTNSKYGDKGTNGYILNSNNIKNINFSNPKILSLNNIQTLINIIEADYELDDSPDIFTSFIPSEELGLLWNLDKLTYRYSFQKGYFYDMSWDDSGKVTSIFWCLSFEKVNFCNSNKEPEELTLYIKADLDELSNYKISSISKN